jgi:hypothetical protein
VFFSVGKKCHRPWLPDGIFSYQKNSDYLKSLGVGTFWYILRTSGIFWSYLENVMAVWYILWPFGVLFPILVYCTKENLATLSPTTWSEAKRRNCCFDLVAINYASHRGKGENGAFDNNEYFLFFFFSIRVTRCRFEKSPKL